MSGRWARLSAALLLLAGGLWWAFGSGDLPAPRHVILISLDTLRADHLGLYGYGRDTSPRLDAFAEQAVVFDTALAPAASTLPSQTSLMTSLYPPQHGSTAGRVAREARFPTLAELLRAAGFQTAGFVDGGFLDRAYGLGRGFETYDDAGGGFARLIPAAQAWIQSHRDRSFFLFLHSYDIHAPYAPPEPFRSYFDDPSYRGRFVPSVAALEAASRGRLQLSPAERRRAVDRYDAGIRYADARLGDFLDFLEDPLGILDETLVLVTSDHGEELGEHGSYLHWRVYYQPNLRVPLLLRLPGGRGSARIAEPVQTVDILPTLLELLDLPPLEAAEGRSLVPLLRRPSGGLRARSTGTGEARSAPAWPPNPELQPYRSVVQQGYQLRLHVGSGEAELFDLARDPMALRDVAAEQPERVRRLRESWRRWAAAEASPPPTRRVAPDELSRERLRALGYLQ